MRNKTGIWYGAVLAGAAVAVPEEPGVIMGVADYGAPEYLSRGAVTE